jgi:hypothetical protein
LPRHPALGERGADMAFLNRCVADERRGHMISRETSTALKVAAGPPFRLPSFLCPCQRITSHTSVMELFAL